jgi:hypothetical protein
MENPESYEPQPAVTPPAAEREPAQMSELATIGNIFFEPGRTFEDLKRKPRFIIAAIIISLIVTGYSLGLSYKLGDAAIRSFVAEQIDKSPRADAMSAEQKAQAVDMQMKFGSIARYATPIFVFILLLIGGLLYFAGAKAFGGTGGFLHALSVWVYSTLPPAVVGGIANFIVLALKSADDIDLAASQRSLIHANLGFFIDGKTSPVLATLLGTFDVFFIWGWILAAIGLRITNRLSSGSAWGVVLLIGLIGTVIRVLLALVAGTPM